MSKRQYRAVVSTRRLNAILQMLLFDKLTQNDICIRAGLGDRQVGKYMVYLQKCHKICWERPATGKQGGAPKVYTLAEGAMPYPELNPKSPPRRPPVEVRQKTGPKPSAKKPPKAELRTVKTVPAQQVGMQRDPFQALFFGQPQRQPGA